MSKKIQDIIDTLPKDKAQLCIKIKNGVLKVDGTTKAVRALAALLNECADMASPFCDGSTAKLGENGIPLPFLSKASIKQLEVHCHEKFDSLEAD